MIQLNAPNVIKQRLIMVFLLTKNSINFISLFTFSDSDSIILINNIKFSLISNLVNLKFHFDVKPVRKT